MQRRTRLLTAAAMRFAALGMMFFAGSLGCCTRGLEQLSVFDGDNVCLDLTVYTPPPEPLGDSLCGMVGCRAKP